MPQCAVLGAGAIGTLLAGWLSDNSTNCVTLLATDSVAQKIQRNGIRIDTAATLGGGSKIYDQITCLSKTEQLDRESVIFVATKATQLVPALDSIAHSLRPDTIIVTLQNGIGIDQIVRTTLGKKVRHVHGILYIASIYHEPGLVTHTGGTAIEVEEDPHSPLLQKIVQETPIILRKIPDIHQQVFFKAALNSVINPLSALYAIPVGELLHPKYNDQVERLVAEATSVAEIRGYQYEEPIAEVLYRSIRMISTSYSSMYQDIQAGRATEIEYINGAIAALGESHNLPMPTNRQIVEQIQSLTFRL